MNQSMNEWLTCLSFKSSIWFNVSVLNKKKRITHCYFEMINELIDYIKIKLFYFILVDCLPTVWQCNAQ